MLNIMKLLEKIGKLSLPGETDVAACLEERFLTLISRNFSGLMAVEVIVFFVMIMVPGNIVSRELF